MMSVEKAIWSAYLDNPCKVYSIRELALHVKKSYPLIHQHTSRLRSQHKLRSQQMGKSILCYPNLNNPYTLLALGMAEEERTTQLLAAHPSLSFLREFFSSQVFLGVLSVWQTKEEMVIVVAHESFQEPVEFALSKTTLNQNIVFMTCSNTDVLVESLQQKVVLLFGYEQFFTLIRSVYEKYASKSNMVKLHE